MSVCQYSALMPLAPWENPEFLSSSIKSLEQQSLKPKELVVSYDGIPPSALLEVIDSTFIPVVHVNNPTRSGVGKTLASGMLKCTSEYILRVDSDDISLPSRAARLMQIIANHDAVCVAGGWIQEFTEIGRQGVRRTPEGIICQDSKSRLLFNPINHPTVLLKKHAILNAGNYHHIPCFEDFDLWLRLMKMGYHLFNIPEVLVLARINDEHRKRRHGIEYALKEASFYMHCARQRYCSIWLSLLLVTTRCPCRIVPFSFFKILMSMLRRPS